MHYKYDPEGDAIYIHLTDEPYAYGYDLDDSRRVDFGPSGHPRGVELLGVSDGVDTVDLPERQALEELLLREGFKVFA